MAAQPEDPRFTLLKSFPLIVPVNYVHDTQLTKFREANHNKFTLYNNDITDQNFSKVTTKLVPGRKFNVKIFAINIGKYVSSKGCLIFLRKQKAVFVGTQGASLIWQKKKEKLPINKWSISFDEKKALWKEPRGYFEMLPCVDRFSAYDWRFHLVLFRSYWSDNDCLICFCDPE